MLKDCYDSRPRRCLHDRMLPRGGKNAVSLPKCLSAPVIVGLCEAHTPHAPLRPRADSLRTGTFTPRGTGTVFYPSEFSCTVKRRPALQSGGGVAGGRSEDQPERFRRGKELRQAPFRSFRALRSTFFRWPEPEQELSGQ